MNQFFRISAISVACVLAGLCTQRLNAAVALPTQDQVQQMIDAKSYRPALRAIAQIMPTPSSAPAGTDKYALLMMRGECLVQLKDAASASIAFEQAATAADTLSKNEAARAMFVLVRRSPAMVYTPRTGTNKVRLDLTDLAARKQAMAALLADELPAITNRVQEGLGAQSLPPITALWPTLRDLNAVEQTATGDDKQVFALIQPLADRVYALIEAELNRVNEQMLAIQRAASRPVDFGGGSFQTTNAGIQWIPDQGATGLSGDDREQMREAVTYLNNISQTCDDLAAIARRYDRDAQRWQGLAKQTRGLVDFVDGVYNHE